MSESHAVTLQNPPSLTEIFWAFFKIGCVGFGGHLALVAMIEREFVERRKLASHQHILDAVALASALPGPLAVNVVAYLGYVLRGLSGALVSMCGIIIPSFILMVVFAIAYGQYGELPVVTSIFSGFLPAVVAIILGVVWKLSQQNIKRPEQWLFFVVAAAIFGFFGGFLTALGLIIGSAIVAIRWFGPAQSAGQSPVVAETVQPRMFPLLALITISVAATMGLAFLTPRPLLVELWVRFSSMSLAMFGGGYVFIPMMKEVVVGQMKWVPAKEFADAIALGQVTPGPIMISATFIGYRIAEIFGALVATIAMFLPSGLLIALCSNLHQRVADAPLVKAAYQGIRPCVLGLILTAAYVLAREMEASPFSVAVVVLTLVASVRFKVDTFYLIPAAGLLGFLWHLV